MANDVIEVEVLPDGSVKFLTDKISPANHRNAEEFMAAIARMLGGKTERTRRRHGHVHHVQPQQVKR